MSTCSTLHSCDGYHKVLFRGRRRGLYCSIHLRWISDQLQLWLRLLPLCAAREHRMWWLHVCALQATQLRTGTNKPLDHILGFCWTMCPTTNQDILWDGETGLHEIATYITFSVTKPTLSILLGYYSQLVWAYGTRDSCSYPSKSSNNVQICKCKQPNLLPSVTLT